MAAPSGTTWGSKVGGYGRIGIYVDVLSDTPTKLKYEVEVWFGSKYSVSDTNNTLYYDHRSSSGSATTSRGSKSISTTVNTGSGWSTSNEKRIATYGPYEIDRKTTSQKRYIYAKLIDVDVVGGAMYASRTYTIAAKTSYTVSFNANGGTGAPGSQTKWHGTALTLSGTKPTRTGYTFQGWGTSASDTSANYQPEGKYESNAAITLYAIWSPYTHTVAFNANGGTNAPVSQTKRYGSIITITTSKPTRTGYTFLHWNTKSDGTGRSYNPGEAYGEDQNGGTVTLYAIWKINTWTVSYNANGGTGAPGNQTKSYGVTLTLSSVKPTRASYNFKGWATSASSTTVVYNSGGSYTSNANITLYAVWELAYKKPTISNLQVSRCDGNGEPVGDDVEFTSGLISFQWATFFEISRATITWISGSGEVSGSKTVEGIGGTSGTISQIFGDGLLPLDQTFAVSVTVADSGGSTVKSITLEGYLFTIDMLGGGKGVSFGKPAELEDVADFEFEAYFRNGIRPLILSNNTDLNDVKIPNSYTGDTATTAGYLNCPITTATSFTLEVLSAGSGGQIMQRITSCTKTAPVVYIRHYYANAWGDWITI